MRRKNAVTGGQVRVSVGDGNMVYRSSSTGRDIWAVGHLSGSLTRPTFSHQTKAGIKAHGLDLNSYCNVPFGNCNINFAVTAPTGLPVRLNDSFGNLTAGHLSGPVNLTDNSGDLTTSDLGGQIQLSDQFGNINASRLHGSMRVVNNSGDIDASGLTGPIQMNDQIGRASCRERV